MDATVRRWVPAAYVDEVTPTPRASASDWIVPLPGDGVFVLSPADEDDDDARGPALRDGHRVSFHWMENHGDAHMTIADGKWSVDREPPTGTTHICAYGNPDSVSSDGLDAFAVAYLATEDSDDVVPLFYYSWSEEPVEFEFRAGAFHEVSPP